MSRPKPKSSRSKSGSRLEAVTAAIAGLVSKRNATIVELSNGLLVLMACPGAADCPSCTDARERRRLASTPKPMPSADAATSPEDK
jgi:hypothetical protein